MKKIMDYVKEANTVDEAIEMVASDTRCAIEEWLENLDECDAYEVIRNFNDDIHSMEDLDDVYEYLSVTEVLKQLSDISIYDDYFNAETRESGNDLWEVADEDISDVAYRIYNGDIILAYWYAVEIENIFEEYDRLIKGVKAKFEQYEQARKLFEMMMSENPEETMMILWNGR